MIPDSRAHLENLDITQCARLLQKVQKTTVTVKPSQTIVYAANIFFDKEECYSIFSTSEWRTSLLEYIHAP